tara:strand:- start:1575 stop:1802 length:228 start_codon:yes stop_codon:yes gene_type:complete
MYLASMTIKKTHEHLKHMWARIELGEQKYQRLMNQGNAIEMVCKTAINMPDTYMDVDIYAKFKSEKERMWFQLTY